MKLKFDNFELGFWKLELEIKNLIEFYKIETYKFLIFNLKF